MSGQLNPTWDRRWAGRADLVVALVDKHGAEIAISPIGNPQLREGAAHADDVLLNGVPSGVKVQAIAIRSVDGEWIGTVKKADNLPCVTNGLPIELKWRTTGIIPADMMQEAAQ